MSEQEGIESDSAGGVYHATFGPASEPGSEAVVSSRSDLTGTDPDELESIDAAVDPIVSDAHVRRQRRALRISFAYHDHDVTVDTGGDIRIHDREGGPLFVIRHVTDRSAFVAARSLPIFQRARRRWRP